MIAAHAKSCDCVACAKARAQRTSELWEANGSYAKPPSADSTVFVRSYFRRHTNHLQKFPNTRRLMQTLMKSIKRLKAEE